MRQPLENDQYSSGMRFLRDTAYSLVISFPVYTCGFGQRPCVKVVLRAFASQFTQAKGLKAIHRSVPKLQDRVQGVPYQIQQNLLNVSSKCAPSLSFSFLLQLTSLSRFEPRSKTFLTTRSRYVRCAWISASRSPSRFSVKSTSDCQEHSMTSS